MLSIVLNKEVTVEKPAGSEDIAGEMLEYSDEYPEELEEPFR